MRKIAAVAAAVLCGACVFGGCGGETFVAESYICESSTVTELRITAENRAVNVGVSEDDKIRVDYFNGEKEYFDISVSGGVLKVELLSDKTWTDYIGVKPDARYRKIDVLLPEGAINRIFITTTNEEIAVESLSVTEEIVFDDNGGDIFFGLLSAGSGIRLTAKNGSIGGTVAGGWDDFAITCGVKKGKSNLPARKEDGDKLLAVECNNGDVSIDFKA